MAAAENLALISVDEGILTVRNAGSSPIVAFHFEEPNGDSVNQITEIAPGSQQRYEVKGESYAIDGVLFADGTIQGPNRWGVEKHFKLWQDVMKGGPAYPEEGNYAETGASGFYAFIWSKTYRRKYGTDPLIVLPAPRGPAPQIAGSTIIPSTLYVAGTCRVVAFWGANQGRAAPALRLSLPNNPLVNSQDRCFQSWAGRVFRLVPCLP